MSLLDKQLAKINPAQAAIREYNLGLAAKYAVWICCDETRMCWPVC